MDKSESIPGGKNQAMTAHGVNLNHFLGYPMSTIYQVMASMVQLSPMRDPWDSKCHMKKVELC